MRAIRHLRHLATRFFDVLRSSGLRPREQAEATALLRPEERPLFWDQPVADQRHALEGARYVLRTRPGRVELARAALLHDVGKRHSRLGTAGRTAATVLGLLRLPAPSRLAGYLAHGELGAGDLEAAGAEPLVVAFARAHHGDRPAAIPEPDWQLLQAADHQRLGRR